MIFPLLLKQVSVAIATYKVVDEKQYEEEGWGLGERKRIMQGTDKSVARGKRRWGRGERAN